MKYLLVLFVVLIAAWLVLGRRGAVKPPDADPSAPQSPPQPKAVEPPTMVACAHCGMHLPEAEASLDGEGRPFCGDPHRALGAR